MPAELQVASPSTQVLGAGGLAEVELASARVTDILLLLTRQQGSLQPLQFWVGANRGQEPRATMLRNKCSKRGLQQALWGPATLA